MNTIPTTSKNTKIPYTVVSGQKTRRKKAGIITLCILNRGGRPYKQQDLADLAEMGFGEIISIEGPHPSYDVESLSRVIPQLKFILLHEAASSGEKVNIGIDEASGEFVFVVWNDLSLTDGIISSRLEDKIRTRSILCTVPVLQTAGGETIPSIQAPAFFKKHLKVVAVIPQSDGLYSLFPFDYCGIYNKDKFLLTGGFDPNMGNPYWQKMDFGFRAFMWGHEIACNSSLKLTYRADVPTEDTTPDDDYRTFFLKNLSIKYSGDSGSLPFSRFPSYFIKSGIGPLAAWKDFMHVRRWVKINTYLFIQDARRITELWEIPDRV